MKSRKTTNYIDSTYSRMGGIYRMMLNYLHNAKNQDS